MIQLNPTYSALVERAGLPSQPLNVPPPELMQNSDGSVTRIQSNGIRVILDPEVAKWLGNARLTHIKNKSYLAIRIAGVIQYLHRIITNCPPHMVVDHINGNGCDNRLSNLRICSNAENLRHRVRLNRNNSTGKRGVYKRGNRWVAEIKICRKKIFLGAFKSLEDATKARTEAEQDIFKEYKGSV